MLFKETKIPNKPRSKKKEASQVVKIEDSPPEIKIEDNGEPYSSRQRSTYLKMRRQIRNGLRIKRGVMNVKIVGRPKGKKIRKHEYFSSQQTLDKYV